MFFLIFFKFSHFFQISSIFSFFFFIFDFFIFSIILKNFSKQVIKQKISSESKIILVIDRVDKFIDPTLSKEANIAFWLPRLLPDKVRVIITCDKASESFQYFLKNEAKIMEITTNMELTNFLIERNLKKEGFIDKEVKGKLLECLQGYGENLRRNAKFVDIYLNSLLPRPNEVIRNLGKNERLELNIILKTMDFTGLSSFLSFLCFF